MAQQESKDPGWSPPRPIRPGQRVPSGPRPAPPTRDSFTSVPSTTTTAASGSIPRPIAVTVSAKKVRHVPSLTSLAALGFRSESPLDALMDADGPGSFTTSPEQSPPLLARDAPGTPTKGKGKAVSIDDLSPILMSAPRRPTSPMVAGLPMPPPTVKPRPNPLRVNTNLAPPLSSPTKVVSPSLKHWQQVRSHVVSTPIDEKTALQQIKGKKQGIVSKAAGKFGFRQAADHVIGYDDRRKSMAVVLGDLGDLTAEEREEITRERRRLARDIKACLDGCMAEESRRRLTRASGGSSHVRDEARHRASSIPLAGAPGPSNYQVSAADFSAYAPLLKEFSNYAAPARAKKPWCRTCPHHGAILGELATAFLPDRITSVGERQQTLEVFVALVKQWAPDNAEEEMDRWLFLCHALRVDDRSLRNRGLGLLQTMLRDDPNLPQGHERPHTAYSFQRLSMGLLELLYAVRNGQYDTTEHYRIVADLLADLAEGEIMDVDPDSLEQVFGHGVVLDAAAGGIEKELLWLTIGKALGSSPHMASWLLLQDAQVLQSFSPPPLLHATPPLILTLRSHAIAHHLESLAEIFNAAEESDLPHFWAAAAERIADVDHLPEDAFLTQALGWCLVAAWRRSTPAGNVPSAEPQSIRKVSDKSNFDPQPIFLRCLASNQWKSGIESAFRDIIQHRPTDEAAELLRLLLEAKDVQAIGKTCVPLFFNRLVEAPSESPTVKRFLAYLSTGYPQLLYKPLFSLSASTQASNLSKHLSIVRALASAMSPAQFWTTADPHMVVIILMGDSSPKLAKGKGKEGDAVAPSVKLGRYAVLLEFLAALDGISEPAGGGTRLRGYIETLEARLGAMLEAEDAAGGLTGWYKALMCSLFFKLRSLTKSVRRSGWQRLALSWFVDCISASPHASPSDSAAKMSLSSAYQSLSQSTDIKSPESSGHPRANSVISPPIRSNTANTSRHFSVSSLNPVEEREEFRVSMHEQGARLLVLISACLAHEDWSKLAMPLWRYLAEAKLNDVQAIGFLLMKTGQLAPEQLRHAIVEDLQSSNALLRAMALSKLAKLYGYRFQVLAQSILSDRRGPVFRWPPKTVEFVTTEIGSPTWSAPQEVQDAALQKFGGKNLPLELRQRLMQLGWSDDADIGAELDAEKMPVSSLPSSRWVDKASTGDSQAARPMARRDSSGSEASTTATKKRKAIYAPVMTSTIHLSALLLSHEVDGIVDVLSHEIVRLLQRDDPGHLLRPFTDSVLHDFPRAIASLNSMAITATPGFAYAALNGLVGYLKHVLRDHPNHPSHAAALSTIALLTPHVSEISLRDVRKNKGEPILLPASIHEEHGGFKIHATWHDGVIAVQTAQLLFLTECLKANPREVYLIKKMMSNLPITASAPDLYFARAWLVLITALFGTLNRNYNDRGELRHFLANAAIILRSHGKDLLVVTHACRVFMLCAARFRRLFATAGFSTVMRSVYEVYADGDPAVRDCVEYACRSFYRIHGDAFVFQTVVAISEGDFDSSAAYGLLSSLSVGNSPSSGVSSGIRGLNDAEEIDALVQLHSGPEIALHEIGTDRAERQAAKMSALEVDSVPFPKENIVKLLVTAIAASPSAARSGRWLRLFGGMIPHITDAPSRELLHEGVEALGVLIARARSADEAAIAAFHGSAEGEAPDWLGARREYIRLVDQYARAGGTLGASATKVVLEIVLDLLRKDPSNVGSAAGGILGQLTKTHLASPRAAAFLRDIAPLYGQFAGVVDFGGVLDSISDFIVRHSYNVHGEMAEVIITSYVEPSVRLLAAPPSETSLLGTPLRASIVRLVRVAVFISGDAWGAVERHPPNAAILAALILPLALLLEAPSSVDRTGEFRGLWMRILQYISKTAPPSRGARSLASEIAVAAILRLQIIKIVTLRAPDAIGDVKGLWTYISTHLLRVVAEGDGKFTEPAPLQPPPRVVDWMMWSLFELLALHSCPLMITFRHHIQIHLSALHQSAQRSRPSTPGSRPALTVASPLLHGRARMASMRSPSMALHAPSPSGTPSPEAQGHHRIPSAGRWTPESAGHSRIPSTHLSPHMGHSRNLSGSLSVPGGHRPSFADLSARRASRPVFDGLPSSPNDTANAMRFRFPSTAPIRNLPTTEKGGGGAIVHLLGATTQVLSATSAILPSHAPPRDRGGPSALRDIKIKSPALVRGAKRAVRGCMVVFGYSWDADPEDGGEDAVRAWSAHDALNEIAEQTRLVLEEEFKDVFAPPAHSHSEDPKDPTTYFARRSHEVEKVSTRTGGYSLDQMTPRKSNEYNEKSYDDEYHLLHDYSHDHDHDPDESFGKRSTSFEIPRLAITTP